MACPPITTHSGLRPLTWRKTQGGRKPNAPFTHTAPPPPHSSSQWTTPSRGLTPNGFDLQTHPKHSHAPVVPPSALHNTSRGNAHCSIKHALTTQSTHMGAQSLTPPSITPTHTNYSRSFETVVLHRVLLILAPQRK
jgi:hypothetical protein